MIDMNIARQGFSATGYRGSSSRVVVRTFLLVLALSCGLATADTAAGDAPDSIAADPIAIPSCAPHEGLCPVKRGSNELHVCSLRVDGSYLTKYRLRI
jgi:hypothetical protein